MELNDRFKFGQYKGLSLKEVYQGNSNIDKNLFKKYLDICIKDNNVPKPHEFYSLDLLITEEEMLVFPGIFNEEEPESLENVIYLGDLSQPIEYYFSCFFNKNWYGIVEHFEKFNHKRDTQVIGGDPEYIEWCIRNVANFSIDKELKSQLELISVHRLRGILVTKINNERYRYEAEVLTEKFKFRE